MSRFNETSVVIHDCTIVWDGLTNPDKDQQGAPKYSLKVVIPPNSPDLAEFNQIAQEKLQSSKFRGTLPQGGRMPVGTAGPQEFGGMFPGFGVVSAKTKFMPTVHGEDVSVLDPMQFAPLMFPGQRVNILVDCYEYDSMGNKGIGAGLQGVQIVTSAGAQRLALGGGGADTASAFGGQPQPAAGPYAPPGAPVGPPPQQPQQGGHANGYYPGQPPQQPQQPAQVPPPQQGGYVQQQQQPQQGGYVQQQQQPQQGGYVQQQQGGAYPQQAQDFLPVGPPQQ